MEKREIRKKAEEYLKRAEEVKKLSKDSEGWLVIVGRLAFILSFTLILYGFVGCSSSVTVPSEKVQFIHIKEGCMGYSYANVFSKCLDGNLEWIEVEDPYIRARHQVSLKLVTGNKKVFCM